MHHGRVCLSLLGVFIRNVIANFFWREASLKRLGTARHEAERLEHEPRGCCCCCCCCCFHVILLSFLLLCSYSQEAAARHEAERLEQEARGRLERQKIEDEAEAEKSKEKLLQLQVPTKELF